MITFFKSFFSRKITNKSFELAGIEHLSHNLYGKNWNVDASKHVLVCQHLPEDNLIIISLDKNCEELKRESTGCVYFKVKTSRDVITVIKSILNAFPRPFNKEF